MPSSSTHYTLGTLFVCRPVAVVPRGAVGALTSRLPVDDLMFLLRALIEFTVCEKGTALRREHGVMHENLVTAVTPHRRLRFVWRRGFPTTSQVLRLGEVEDGGISSGE